MHQKIFAALQIEIQWRDTCSIIRTIKKMSLRDAFLTKFEFSRRVFSSRCCSFLCIGLKHREEKASLWPQTVSGCKEICRGSHNLGTGLSLRHSPAFVRWYILLIIGTLRAKGIRKNILFLEEGRSAIVPPTTLIMSHIKDRLGWTFFFWFVF